MLPANVSSVPAAWFMHNNNGKTDTMAAILNYIDLLHNYYNNVIIIIALMLFTTYDSNFTK